MIRTVVAFDNEKVMDTVADLLEKNGISVRYRCRTGYEVVRAVKKMGGGAVICSFKLPDLTADELSYELQELAFFLVVAKPNMLELCENEDIFKLKLPLKSGELIGSVNMLLQLDARRSRVSVPKRSKEDEALILKAKELVMEKNSISEDMAYRFMQRRSMETSSPMTEIARLILTAFDT